LKEGLAMFFEEQKFSNGCEPIKINRKRLEHYITAIQNKPFLNLNHLLFSSSNFMNYSHTDLNSAYAYCWAYFFYLRMYSPQELADYLNSCGSRPDDFNSAMVDEITGFHTQFGINLNSFNIKVMQEMVSLIMQMPAGSTRWNQRKLEFKNSSF